jgi:hypothetical protein
MLDTIALHINPNQPKTVLKRSPEPFLWKGIKFEPYYNKKGSIQSYAAKLNNLYLTFNENGLYIANSWHKYYHQNNWSDYTFSEIVDTYNKLNDKFNGLIEKAKIRRVDYGVNMEGTPFEFCSNWMFLRTKSPIPMQDKGKVYGKKFFATEYNLKAYDKTIETKSKYHFLLSKQITRIEKSVFRMRNLTQRKINPIRLTTAKDLTDIAIIRQLADDFCNTCQKIEKVDSINFLVLTAPQIKVVAAMQNPEARKALRKNSYRTFKRYMKTYRKIMKDQKSENLSLKRIRLKVEYLISA